MTLDTIPLICLFLGSYAITVGYLIDLVVKGIRGK